MQNFSIGTIFDFVTAFTQNSPNPDIPECIGIGEEARRPDRRFSGKTENSVFKNIIFS